MLERVAQVEKGTCDAVCSLMMGSFHWMALVLAKYQRGNRMAGLRATFWMMMVLNAVLVCHVFRALSGTLR